MITTEPADWIRTVAVSTATYAALVAIHKVSDKRAVAELNVFDPGGLLTKGRRTPFSTGSLDPEAMRKMRVNESKIRASIRCTGLGSLARVRTVVLETDGSISVVRRGTHERTWSSMADQCGSASRLDDARRFDQ